MTSESSAQPVQQPQEASALGQEDTPEQAAQEEPQQADHEANGDGHPDLSAKVKEKNARTQGRGQLQGGG